MSYFFVSRVYPDFKSGPHASYEITDEAVFFPGDTIPFVALNTTRDAQNDEWKIVTEDLPGPGPVWNWNWNWTTNHWEAPPPPPATQAQKDAVKAVINATRDARISGGFTFQPVDGGPAYPIQSDQSDRENVVGLKLIAQTVIDVTLQSEGSTESLVDNYRWIDDDHDFEFICGDNTRLKMDPFAVIKLFHRGVAFKLATTMYARDLKDAVQLAETTADLAAINISTGWPS